MVNKMLEESGAAGAEGQGDDSEEADAWEGFPDRPDLEMIDHVTPLLIFRHKKVELNLIAVLRLLRIRDFDVAFLAGNLA